MKIKTQLYFILIGGIQKEDIVLIYDKKMKSLKTERVPPYFSICKFQYDFDTINYEKFDKKLNTRINRMDDDGVVFYTPYWCHLSWFQRKKLDLMMKGMGNYKFWIPIFISVILGAIPLIQSMRSDYATKDELKLLLQKVTKLDSIQMAKTPK